MRIILIRHGRTAGNIEKRYIGRTDEPLCYEGIAELRAFSYPSAERLICSPMRRCIETAGIIFPGQSFELCPELRECDFGRFDGKNYQELSGDTDYQRWIDSGGTLPFPSGESPQDFRRRCCEGFAGIVESYPHAGSIGFVVHGGTIMAVLERYARPHRDYFGWHCENGHGYICRWDGEKLEVTERI